MQVRILLNPTFQAYFFKCFERFSFSYILHPTFFYVSRSLHPHKLILHLTLIFFSFVCFERFSIHLLSCCCPFLSIFFIEHGTFVTSSKLQVPCFFSQTKSSNVASSCTNQTPNLVSSLGAFSNASFWVYIEETKEKKWRARKN